MTHIARCGAKSLAFRTVPGQLSKRAAPSHAGAPRGADRRCTTCSPRALQTTAPQVESALCAKFVAEEVCTEFKADGCTEFKAKGVFNSTCRNCGDKKVGHTAVEDLKCRNCGDKRADHTYARDVKCKHCGDRQADHNMARVARARLDQQCPIRLPMCAALAHGEECAWSGWKDGARV